MSETASLKATTREQFLTAARRLFAERGFYGTSIAAIAQELGLTKQALLHHFGSKEKLYGELLREMSTEIEEQTQLITRTERDPLEQLVQMICLHYRIHSQDTDAARLIMRELLDNEQRAQQAGNWYLKGWLEQLLDTLMRIEPLQGITRDSALAVIYQFLGAAHYFAVSGPTLDQIFGARPMQRTAAVFEAELATLVRTRCAG